MLVSVQQDCSCAGAGSLFCRLPAAVPLHFFKTHRGELKTHRHGAWKLPPTSPTGYKFMQSELAAPQQRSPEAHEFAQQIRSAATLSLKTLTNLAKPNSQCRNASSQIPRICGSKFAVPQRSSQPLTNLAKPNSQCRNASSQIPRICGSKFAVPQRISVAASRLPNTARRRG